jgi:hypothetical protein
MHTPISTLKTAVREPEATTVVDIVRRLFDLQDKNQRDKDPIKKNSQTAAEVGEEPGAKS